jgi:hypothetical protein
MTIFVSTGDSFTFGNELEDCIPIPGNGIHNGYMQQSQFTWAALTAKYLGFEQINVSSPGISNPAITRRCIYEVERLLETGEDLIVGIMWTFHKRVEVYSKVNNRVLQDLDSYQTVGSYHQFTFEEKLKLLGGYQIEKQYQTQLKAHEWDEDAGLGDISRIYEKYLDNTFFLMESLRNIAFLMSYLESKNIKYFFLKAANIGIDDQKNYYDVYSRSFKKIIDKANWIPAPYFCDWAKVKKYKIGPANHPLEEAHAAYTEQYIIPYLNSRGIQKSIL